MKELFTHCLTTEDTYIAIEETPKGSFFFEKGKAPRRDYFRDVDHMFTKQEFILMCKFFAECEKKLKQMEQDNEPNS